MIPLFFSGNTTVVSHGNLYYLIQNVVDFGTTLQKINVMKSVFILPSVSTFSWGALEIFYILGSFYTSFRISV
jgi:hypothetical protein